MARTAWPCGEAPEVGTSRNVQERPDGTNLFQPVIHRYTVQLNPLWIILAVLVGANVLGVLGALLAIPVAGIVQVLVQEWWSVRRGATPVEAGP